MTQSITQIHSNLHQGTAATNTNSASNSQLRRVEEASVKRQVKHLGNLFGDSYLCGQSGAGVIHWRSSGCRSAFGGHMEGAAMGLLGKRVSLGLGG